MDRETALLWIRDAAEQTEVLAGDAPAGPVSSGNRVNPTCGDRVELTAHLSEDGVVRLRGRVRGCVLSTAAANLAAAAIEGLPLVEAIAKIDVAVQTRLFATDSTGIEDDLGELASLELVPLRRRCVALPWQLTADLLRELSPAG